MFASDNWAGASDRVMATLVAANADQQPAYGRDAWTRRADAALAEFFGREVAALYVPTGSGANSLALATLQKPGGVVFAHLEAHVARDEAGAPLLFAPGTMLHLVDGAAGKIGVDELADALARYPDGGVHHGRPAAVTLTNVNEIGQVYTPDEVAALADLAKANGAAVHVDGARFLNAVASLNCDPADLTWRAGVDAISLGLTKTGAFCAEVVVLFDAARALDAQYRQKQGAMLFSKNRFVAAQVVALLEEDHGLGLARHANMCAARLAQTLEAAGAPPLYAPAANEVFAWLTDEAYARLAAADVLAYAWSPFSARHPERPSPAHRLHRFVTSWRTGGAEIAEVAATLAAAPA
jgi:threonine aldolase